MRVARAAAPLLILVALSGGVALAGPVEDRLGEARAAIIAGDYKTALKALDAAQAAAPGAETVVSAKALARIWYYRGVVEHLQGDKKGRAMDHWRQALVFANDLSWETEVLKADDPETLFEALRSEVRSRQKVDIGAPEAVGLAKLYVDGSKVGAGDRVLSGQHLAQITCPDGKTYGVWTDFSKSVKWLALCPGGVDTSVVANTAPQDDWGEFGPSFGAPADGSADMLDVPFGGPEPAEPAEPAPATVEAPTEAAPAEPAAAEQPSEPVVAEKPAEPAAAEQPVEQPSEPVVAEKPAEPAAVEQPAEKPAEPAVAEKPAEKPAEPAAAETPKEEVVAQTQPAARSGRGPGVFLMAGGGALLVGGVAANFALVNPTWAEIEAARADPMSITRSDADALTARFDTMRLVTLGLLGGGVALTGVGVLIDSPVTPVLGPGQLGVSGRF